MLDVTPCPADGSLSLETIFDIVQTPIMGIVIGLVLYFQLRKQETVQRPALWASVAGVFGAALYGAYKFLL